MQKQIITALLLLLSLVAKAQVGEHRNDLCIGGNAGFVMSNVGFAPRVSQTMKKGMTFGGSVRYICEKYFNTICSIYGEINYTAMGWNQDIRTKTGEKVMNPNGAIEAYSRTLNYVQIPVFAHLAWGKERNGFNFFVQAGPQIGFFVSETTSKNYETPNIATDGTGRSNTIANQENMPVEKKFDYGIAAGLGTEYSNDHIGHFLLEARYYYGLGNIYGNTKKDYFGKSNNGSFLIKATYLFDITKSKNNK
ncbi:porin family protein [Prevotella disiens]|uniref:porin family protein n=1 Tax=Prevotella disiens TaxID=28130 RepID=UPI00288C464C|nr:porin family protein [Prevotella disiens]